MSKQLINNYKNIECVVKGNTTEYTVELTLSNKAFDTWYTICTIPFLFEDYDWIYEKYSNKFINIKGNKLSLSIDKNPTQLRELLSFLSRIDNFIQTLGNTNE